MDALDADRRAPPLERSLGNLTVYDLKQRVSFHRGRKPTRKAELIALLEGYLLGEGLAAIWARLGRLERLAVAEIVHGDDIQLRLGRFAARYGGSPRVEKSDLRLLLYGGFIPRELRATLRALAPPPPPVALATLDAPPEARVLWEDEEPVGVELIERERAAGEELVAALRLVDARKVSVSAKTRRPTAASQRALGAILAGGDFYADLPTPPDETIGAIRAFAWPMLLQAAGLVTGSGRLQLTPVGRKALGAPPTKTLRSVWKKWLKTTLLDEFSRVESIKGQSGRKAQLTATSRRRATIAAALAACPPGRWVEVDEFFRYMVAAEHDFEVARQLWELYFFQKRYGSLGYSGYGDWEIVQGRYVLAFLLEYAATLGVVDVACVPPTGARHDYHGCWGTDEMAFLSRYDGLLAFRLTSLGAWCLGSQKTYTPPTPAVRSLFHVQPDLEIVVVAPRLPAGDRLALERWAASTGERTWRLDRGRILAAVEEGHAMASLRAFLSERTAHPLPATVTQMLSDVEDRAGALRPLGLARLIDCRDEALALQLASERKLKGLVLRAGPTLLAVPAEKEAALRKKLRALGYVLPAG